MTISLKCYITTVIVCHYSIKRSFLQGKRISFSYFDKKKLTLGMSDVISKKNMEG